MANRLRIDGSFYLLGALCILILPLRWLLAAFVAAFFHECCHYAAVRLCKGQVLHIRISCAGAEMEVSPLSNPEELFCAAAGPIGSLSLMLLCRVFPELAVCALMQGIFNLLPVYPMDGGRILRCLLCEIIPDHARSVSDLIAVICLGILGILCAARGLGALFAALMVCIHLPKRKIPCKEEKLAVQ